MKFSRYSQRLFTVSSLEITSNIDDLVIRAGFDAKINFYVKNIGTKAVSKFILKSFFYIQMSYKVNFKKNKSFLSL